MTRRSRIFWVGLLIYAASFFLIALGGSPGPCYGFYAAFYAFILPWNNHPIGPGGIFDSKLEWLSLLLSGWINPIFLTAAFLDLTGIHKRAFAILRVVVVLVTPFCWIFFVCSHDYYPREGHFIWILGMLVVLFSRKIAMIHGSR